MAKEKAAEILRLKIKELAENQGIFDRRSPSRTYCGIAIQAMAALLDMSITDLTNKIETKQPSS